MELLQVPFVMLIAALIFLPAVGIWRAFHAERIRRRLMESQLRRLSRELGESELQLWDLRYRMKAAEREIRELQRQPAAPAAPLRTIVPTANISAAAPVNPRFTYVKGE